MKLDLAPEDVAFREEANAWVAAQLPQDIARKVHQGLRLEKADMQLWARILGAKGWHGVAWPREFGGPGWTPIQRHLFVEACALAGAPAIVPFGPVMVAPVLMKFGTPDQQRRHLPGIMSGDVWWCQGYSEPDSGSDLASLRTRAERRGDRYLVNGQKTWTTLGHYADWMFCLVRTSAEGAPQAGISFLLIDMASPGITVQPIITLDGEHTINDVFLDNVEVPVEQRVGAENEGWACAKYLLGHERTNIADVARSKRELMRLKHIARFEGLWDDSRFRDQIAALEVDVVALEMTVLRALGTHAGARPLEVAALLKIRGSEIQQRYTELMMLAAGPAALPFIHEAMDAGWQGNAAELPAHCLPLAGAYFSHRKTSIYGGSNEVQRNIIARRLFGA